MTTERWFVQDITQPIVVQHCEGVVFTADNNGNIIGVKLYKDGANFSPSGTATCNVIRPDGVTVSFDGTVSGNAISATLPVTALAVPGVIGIVLQSISGSVVTTVFKGQFTCELTTTETVVAPSVPTSSLAQLTQDVIDLQNNKVNRAGDTMTGTLTLPRINSVSATYPAYWYMIDANTDAGYQGVRVSDRRFVIAYRNGAGVNQQFSLPPLSGDTSASTWYDILTSKSPVTVAQGGTGATTQAGAMAVMGAYCNSSNAQTFTFENLSLLNNSGKFKYGLLYGGEGQDACFLYFIFLTVDNRVWLYPIYQGSLAKTFTGSVSGTTLTLTGSGIIYGGVRLIWINY